MGFFDKFLGKRTALDDFTDIAKQASKQTNVPLMCYKMAYDVLPKALFGNTDATLAQIQTQINSTGFKNAGFPFFMEACLSHGCTPPALQKADIFNLAIGDLTPAVTYIVFTYPKPQPVQTNQGLPILAPLCSAFLFEKGTQKMSYYVLGQSLDGGTMLRSVNAGGVNMSLGRCNAPNFDAFIELLKQKHPSPVPLSVKIIPASQKEREELVMRLYRHRYDTDPSMQMMAEMTGQDPMDVPMDMLMTGSTEASILAICEQFHTMLDQGVPEKVAVRQLNELHTSMLSTVGEILPKLGEGSTLFQYLRHYVDTLHSHGAPVTDAYLADAVQQIKRFYGR